MRTTRTCCLVFSLAMVALAVVHLRAEQTRTASSLLRLESRWVALRREWWGLQSQAARMHAPKRIHDRLQLINADLVAPIDDVTYRSADRLADRR